MDIPKEIYVCIHGHFYQPPRENPWIDMIEKQPSATPFHDWNERIAKECYVPNTASRCLDTENKIESIINNFEFMSFNFGPTLLNWLEKHHVSAYKKIIDADKISCQRNNGHGNAIAQCFNHVIMPLSRTQDKITQIEWGIADFKRHFSRMPESIWLAETAVNNATIEILIDFGISYIILSPFQAEKIRRLSSRRWYDVSDGAIDTKRSYRIYSQNSDGSKNRKRFIDCFFYNPSISSAVSFEHLLRDASAFTGKLASAIDTRREDSQIISLCTDGETYGHHEPFGDMCLAWFFKNAQKTGFNITNFGSFLEEFPPIYEVELKEGYNNEGTSWSCAHGVSRWYRDCGCSTGGSYGWNQKWRTPLRKSLEYLGKEAEKIFLSKTRPLLNDPWSARNSYYSVFSDLSEKNKETFFLQHASKKLSAAERTEILTMLESQRYAQYMFTSCGWFFSELSGIETVQNLKYAARVIDFIKPYTDEPIEETFLSILKNARSNIAEHGTGSDIYTNMALPSRVHEEILISNFAMRSFIRNQYRARQNFHYTLTPGKIEKLRDGIQADYGHISVKNTILETVHNYVYYLFVPTLKDMCCFVFPENHDPKKPLSKITAEEAEKLPYCEKFSLSSILFDYREKLIRIVLREELKAVDVVFHDLFDKHRMLIETFNNVGVEVPSAIKTIAEEALTSLVNTELTRISDPHSISSYATLEKYLLDASSLKLSVNMESVEDFFYWIILEYIEKIAAGDFEICSQFIELYSFADKNRINIELTTPQEILYAFIENIENYTIDESTAAMLEQIITRFGIASSLLRR